MQRIAYQDEHRPSAQLQQLRRAEAITNMRIRRTPHRHSRWQAYMHTSQNGPFGVPPDERHASPQHGRLSMCRHQSPGRVRLLGLNS